MTVDPTLLLAAGRAVDAGAELLRRGRLEVGSVIPKGDRDYATEVDFRSASAPFPAHARHVHRSSGDPSLTATSTGSPAATATPTPAKSESPAPCSSTGAK